MNEYLGICPVCESGHLHNEIYTDEFSFNGASLLVDGLECAICTSCGADPILESQVKQNQKKITDAKRVALGRLTSSEIASIRDDLGLTQKQASEIFGGGKNAFSKYERGEVIQSEPMDRLLKLARDLPECIGHLCPSTQYIASSSFSWSRISTAVAVPGKTIVSGATGPLVVVPIISSPHAGIFPLTGQTRHVRMRNWEFKQCASTKPNRQGNHKVVTKEDWHQPDPPRAACH